MRVNRERTVPAGPLRCLAAAPAALLCSALLTGCVSGVPADDVPGGWVDFGPFEKRERFADEAALHGLSELRLPGGDVVELDAEELLGSGVKLPARDDYTVLDQAYSYTSDNDTGRPLIVGLVQTKRQMHYRGYSEYEYVTFVLGISADPEPRELARTRVLRAGKHTAEFAGRSDLGVVAVLLEGVLTVDSTPDSRVVGVDAVRGTEVWVKEHGYPVYGEGTAAFYVAPTPESCASEVQRYEVANGIAEESETYPNTDTDQGGTCRTAAEDGGALTP